MNNQGIIAANPAVEYEAFETQLPNHPLDRNALTQAPSWSWYNKPFSQLELFHLCDLQK